VYLGLGLFLFVLYKLLLILPHLYFSNCIDLMRPDGLMTEYLKSAKIAVIIGDALILHGALHTYNMGWLPPMKNRSRSSSLSPRTDPNHDSGQEWEDSSLGRSSGPTSADPFRPTPSLFPTSESILGGTFETPLSPPKGSNEVDRYIYVVDTVNTLGQGSLYLVYFG
jgi:hypothetical protein